MINNIEKEKYSKDILEIDELEVLDLQDIADLELFDINN